MRSKAASPKVDRRPTPDQLYLMDKLNGEGLADDDPGPIGNRITIPALQKWNVKYGVAAVSDALRAAWGFPPLAWIENPYAYVDGILRSTP
jgi:hypothetical protein